MYGNIPVSCEFGGCQYFDNCPNPSHKKEAHPSSWMSPPDDLTKCADPCNEVKECFTYMDKYDNNRDIWEEGHGREY